MFNLFLYSNSFAGATIRDIETSLISLNHIIINADEFEFFWKNDDSLFNVTSAEGKDFSQVIWGEINEQFRCSVLPRLLHRINETGRNYHSIEEFDNDYMIFNAFYGIIFATAHSKYICGHSAYDDFRNNCIEHELKPEQFASIANTFLPNLIFSDRALKGIESIKGSELFLEIVRALLRLNSSNAAGWKRGYYDYRSLPIKMSMESESTMNDPKLNRLRYFTFSDRKERCCELHVKINRDAHRIHIFPENGKIYVGYIGVHLPTSGS